MRPTTIAFLLVVSAFLFAVATPAGAYEPQLGEAVLYQSADCTGAPFLVAKNGAIYNDLRLREMSTGSQWEHAVNCIHVGADTQVTIFAKSDYRGVSLTLTRTQSNPAGVWTLGRRWNDDVSSIKVH